MDRSAMKWLLALALGILFAIISLPFTYSLTNTVFKYVKVNTISSPNSNVTVYGFVLHTIVFILLARLILHFYN